MGRHGWTLTAAGCPTRGTDLSLRPAWRMCEAFCTHPWALFATRGRFLGSSGTSDFLSISSFRFREAAATCRWPLQAAVQTMRICAATDLRLLRLPAPSWSLVPARYSLRLRGRPPLSLSESVDASMRLRHSEFRISMLLCGSSLAHPEVPT
ncbi:uncharacterized protein LOC134540150 [Bacillus rossius redtenbacheri]|uniref:uncharacterized protein LOC134540150 n=1 Tax=Bacillus rossius redtenbacheri TaxID=93214 RepID=UPI002FDEA862